MADEEHDAAARVERRHRGRGRPPRAAHHAAARIDLVEDEIAEVLDAVVLLDDDLARARFERARDGGVRVLRS